MIKFNSWAYENEHRLIYYNEEQSPPLLLNLKENGKTLIEIKEVIFGCNCPDDEQKMIKKALANYEGISFFKAEKGTTDNLFELQCKNIPSNHDYVNFDECDELKTKLRKHNKAQTKDNIQELTKMGDELKRKKPLTHDEFDEYIKHNIDRLHD